MGSDPMTFPLTQYILVPTWSLVAGRVKLPRLSGLLTHAMRPLRRSLTIHQAIPPQDGRAQAVANMFLTTKVV